MKRMRQFVKSAGAVLVIAAMITNMCYKPINVDAANTVATMDGTDYETIQQAINEAGTNEATITMVSEATESITIGEGQNIVLDLNGYKLTNEGTTDTITNSGELTMIDSKGGGIVDNVASWNTAGTMTGSANLKQLVSAIRNNVSGTVTIYGGKYMRSQENGSKNTGYTIRNNGIMVIEDGEFENSGTYSAMIGNGFYDEYSDNPTGFYPKLTINGGTFTGGRYNLKNDGYGIMTINDGIFMNEEEISYNVINVNQLTINGGTFTSANCNISTENDSSEPFWAGGMKITGGNFNVNGSYYCLAISTANEKDEFIEITGGTYNNAMVEDEWRVAESKIRDVNIILDDYTKVAVGTTDKGTYIFKIVPIKTEGQKEFTVVQGEDFSIDCEGLRMYDLYKDAGSALDIDNRKATVADSIQDTVNDAGDITASYDAQDEVIRVESVNTGTIEFTYESTDSTNPISYNITPIKVNVVKGKINVKLADGTTDEDYSYIIYDSNDEIVAKNKFAEVSTVEVAAGDYRVEVVDRNGEVITKSKVTINGEETDNTSISSDKTEAEVVFAAQVNVKYVVDDNKGTVADDDVLEYTINQNTATGAQPTVTGKTGYTFAGWEMKVGDTVTDFTGEPGDVTITADTTFTAKFVADKCSITFRVVEDKNGNKNGTINDTKEEIVVEMDYGTSIIDIPTPLADEGYEFVGWADANDPDIILTEDEIKEITIAGSTEFIAKFKPLEYSYVIKYVDENGNEIEESVTKTGAYGDIVEELSKSIEGYTAKDEKQTITIKLAGNEIIFVYIKNSEPTSQEPTSSEPTSSEPTSQEPTSQEPTSLEPTSQEPAVWQTTVQPATTVTEPTTTKAAKGKKKTTKKSVKGENSSKSKTGGMDEEERKATAGKTSTTKTATATTTGTPQTGDTQKPIAAAIMFVLSALGLAVMAFRRKNA